MNLNYVSTVVKLLENPIQNLLTNKKNIIKVRAQLPQVRERTIIQLVFLGKLGERIKSCSQKNDYILIEGFVTLQDKNFVKNNQKTIQITVLKSYFFD